MFFTLGLTADIASAHRHEFSSPPVPQPQQRILSPRRSPFPLPRPPPVIEDSPPPPITPPLPTALAESAVRRPGPVMFTEPISDGLSEPGISRSNSTGSIISSVIGAGGRANGAIVKSKTSYQLAHPPPLVHRPRLGVRPKLLLQLQRLSGSARPTPALDVLPSTIFAPRLARKFPRFFTRKDGFGPNDILVVTSEDYASSASSGRGDTSESLEDDSLGTRQLVAAICQMRKGDGAGRGKAEICLGCGSAWEATPLLNGGYELVASNADGSTSTVRWVQRRPTHRRRSSALQASTSVRSDEYEKKFIFSIISPDTRRHPIIACMNRNTIDISDHYATSTALSGTYTPTSPTRSPSSVEYSHTSFFEPHERTLTRTNEYLKALILVSGIWVAFREGWSQNFKYDDTSTPPLINASPGPSNPPRTFRCASMPPNMPENSREARADDFGNNHQGTLQGVGGRLLRSGGHLLHRSSEPQTPYPNSPIDGISRPRRSNSTGTSFIQRSHNRNVSGVREFSNGRPSSALLRGIEGENGTSSLSPTPAQQQRPPIQTDGYVINREPVTPTLTTRHGSISRRRVQSAYYPKAADSLIGGHVVRDEQGGEEGGKKRWGRLKNLFNMVRRTGGVQPSQR